MRTLLKISCLLLCAVGVNAAVLLDGVDDRATNTSVITSSRQPITMMAWVYRNAEPDRTATIYFNGTSSANGFGIWMNNGSGASGTNLTLLVGGVSNDIIVGTRPPLPINTWYHVAITVSSNGSGTWTYRMYTNGVQSGSTNTATSPTTPASASQLGRNFPGQIDDVYVYSRVLTANEILNHAKNRLKYSGQTNCIGYYSLDDGADGVSSGTVGFLTNRVTPASNRLTYTSSTNGTGATFTASKHLQYR